MIDTSVACEVFLARLKLARGDVAGAAALLAKAEQSARQSNFVHRIPDIAAAQVLTLLRQGNLAAAAQLAQTHELPMSQARVSWLRETRPRRWRFWSHCAGRWKQRAGHDERLKIMVLQAVALHAHGETDRPCNCWVTRWRWHEPGGFIRIFVDEGPPMATSCPKRR